MASMAMAVTAMVAMATAMAVMAMVTAIIQRKNKTFVYILCIEVVACLWSPPRVFLSFVGVCTPKTYKFAIKIIFFLNLL